MARTDSAIRDSLLPGTRWSRRTPSGASGPARTSATRVVEVVDAVEALDHDALDAQVVAPHLLDQLGVVDALDPDAARPGDPGLRADDRSAARRGAHPFLTRTSGAPWCARGGVTRRVGVPSTA